MAGCCQFALNDIFLHLTVLIKFLHTQVSPLVKAATFFILERPKSILTCAKNLTLEKKEFLAEVWEKSAPPRPVATMPRESVRLSDSAWLWQRE